MGHLLGALVLAILVVAASTEENRFKRLMEGLVDADNARYLNKRGWCRYSKVSRSHTACLKPPRRKSEGVSASEMKLIVKKHNDLRAGVNPPASNMQTMTWDNEIAMIAQKWASNCKWGHDDNKDRKTLAKTYIGQNVAYSTYPKNWANPIQDWYDEVNHFQYGQGSTNGKAVGHYTQIVWAKSNKIGCGYASCPNSNGRGYFHFYVCNYLPGGNINGWNDRKAIYKPYLIAGNGNTGNNGGSGNNGGYRPKPVPTAAPKPVTKKPSGNWNRNEGCMIDGALVRNGETSSRKMGGWIKNCTCTVKKSGYRTSWSYKCWYSSA